MHLPDRSGALVAISLLWLSWATLSAQWAWGPYNDDWKQHIRSPPPALDQDEPPPRLMYRVALPRNGTSPTLASNGTTYYGLANATGVRLPPGLSTSTPSFANSSSIANTTSTNSSTTAIDSTCGVTSPLFALRANYLSNTTTTTNSSSNPTEGWWLRLSGSMILLTSKRERATGFGVNSRTGHLCVPRTDPSGMQRSLAPLIAVVETRRASSPLYFLEGDFAERFEPEYEPVTCGALRGGSRLGCARGDLTRWSGCGLQVEIGSGGGVSSGGLDCEGVSLSAFRM